MIVKEIWDLKVLVSVFYGFKFGIDEDERQRILRSPFFSRMFNELVAEQIEAYKSVKTIDNSVETIEFWALENRPVEREKVFNYLLKIKSWDDLGEAVHLNIIRNLLSPLVFDESNVREILAELKTKREA